MSCVLLLGVFARHILFNNNFLSRVSNVLDAHRDQTSSDKEAGADAVAGAKVASLLEKFLLGASALEAGDGGHPNTDEKADGYHNWNGDDSADDFSTATQASIGGDSWRGFGGGGRELARVRRHFDFVCDKSSIDNFVIDFEGVGLP